jgi:DNA-binding NtrC family response regulator
VILNEVGLEVAGPFSSCADALAWAEHATPDVALLDYLLKDGPCTALVGTLLRRGVPVLIYSGIRQAESIVRHYEVEKAYRRPRLVQATLDVSAAQVDQGSACYPTGTRDARRRLRPVGRGSLTGA